METEIIKQCASRDALRLKESLLKQGLSIRGANAIIKHKICKNIDYYMVLKDLTKEQWSKFLKHPLQNDLITGQNKQIIEPEKVREYRQKACNVLSKVHRAMNRHGKTVLLKIKASVNFVTVKVVKISYHKSIPCRVEIVNEKLNKDVYLKYLEGKLAK